MKHFWTAAAVTALLGLGATQADAATRHKKHVPVPAADKEEDAKPAAKSRHGRVALRGAESGDEDGGSKSSRRGRSHTKVAAADESDSAKSSGSRRSRHGRGRSETAAASDDDALPTSRGRKTASSRANRREAAAEQDERRGGEHGLIHTEAPEPVTVGRGDTLFALSRKTGVDRETIARLNGLKPPYNLRPGQEIKLPSRRFIALRKGDTIATAAKKVGTDPVALAAFNEADLNGKVRAGQKLYVPDDAAEPEEAKPTKQAVSRKPAPAERRTRERATVVARTEATPPSAATTRRPSARVAMATPTPARSAPPRVRYAEERPFTPQPPIGQPVAQAPVTSSTDGLDAATGLPADSAPMSTTAPAQVASAAGLQTRTVSPPPVQATTGSTSAPVVTRPPVTNRAPVATRPPAATRPTFTTPPQVAQSRPATQTAQSSSSSNGFQLLPPPQQMARNTTVTSPVTGTPYNSLGRPGARDRQGRPTTLPPQVAMEAPSSQPSILIPTPSANLNDIVAAGRGRFMWPVRGALLQGFNHTPNGQGNDGVNIAAKPGEAVRAAAAGEVVYAGDQVPSFGNLVLVKHANGWVTAYAHMAGITVKNRDQVAQGQQIGIAGSTGNVGVTQLHFEMRYSSSARDKAQPVDPMLILPSL